MHALVNALVTFAGSTPVPSPTPVLDPDLVTPGVWGFAAIAFIALAVIALVFDMMRRVRRVRYRADVQAELDAEEAEGRAAEAQRNAEAQRDAAAAGEASDIDSGKVEPDDPRAR